MRAEWVSIGVVGRPHGLKGELCAQLFDPASEILEGVDHVFLAPKEAGLNPLSEQLERFAVRVHRHGTTFRVALAGVHDRTAAEAYRGWTIFLSKADVPPLEEGEYYDFQLQGLEVRSPAGEVLGRVVAVEHPPANDVLVVELEPERRFVDIPLLASMVPSVNVAEGHVVVDLPEGLPTRERR